jgi:phage terminase large subunit-like protein
MKQPGQLRPGWIRDDCSKKLKANPSPLYYPTFIGYSVGGEGRGERQGDGFNQFDGAGSTTDWNNAPVISILWWFRQHNHEITGTNITYKNKTSAVIQPIKASRLCVRLKKTHIIERTDKEIIKTAGTVPPNLTLS